MRFARYSVMVGVFLAALGTSSVAGAQARRGGGGTSGAASSGSGGASGDAAAPETPALRTEGGRRVYVSSRAIEVRGEIQRPYAFLLSGRGSLGYTYFDQAVHFVQEIINAVRRAPF